MPKHTKQTINRSLERQKGESINKFNSDDVFGWKA